MRSVTLAEAIIRALPDTQAGRAGATETRIPLAPEFQLVVSRGPGFPADPPSIRILWGDGTSTLIGMDWTPALPASNQIIAALAPFVHGEGPYRIAWGPDAAHPQCDTADRGQAAGWQKVLTSLPTAPGLGAAVSMRVEAETAALLARSGILIVGLGSVGSYLAEQFARLGIGRISGMDFDDVEIHNLTRMPLSVEDVGLSKTAALTRKLTRLRPELDLELIEGDIVQLAGEQLRPLFEQADLIIAATDQPQAQSRINALGYWAGRPVVFASLYAGAKGGEIVFSVPGITPCYECATGGRRALTQEQHIDAARDPENYARLAGELALVADIHHVTSAAVRIAVSLLAASNGAEIAASTFMTEALGRGHSMVMLGMERGYSIFPALMGDAAGQFAFQSVWLNAQPQHDCAICGPDRQSVDPFALKQFLLSPAERERLRLQTSDDD